MRAALTSRRSSRTTVERREPGARRKRVPLGARRESANRGFAHANNARCSQPTRLRPLPNPDTEILEGTFEGLVRARPRPGVGLVGVRQVTPEGNPPHIRRFPTPRGIAEAFCFAKAPSRGADRANARST